MPRIAPLDKTIGCIFEINWNLEKQNIQLEAMRANDQKQHIFRKKIIKKFRKKLSKKKEDFCFYQNKGILEPTTDVIFINGYNKTKSRKKHGSLKLWLRSPVRMQGARKGKKFDKNVKFSESEKDGWKTHFT